MPNLLVSTGKIDEAEQYILSHSSQLETGKIDTLRYIASEMEKEDRYLAASLIYRHLLLSILEKEKKFAYSHAANYLHMLDSLAYKAPDWKTFGTHQSFHNYLVDEHGKKQSFWSKYGD